MWFINTDSSYNHNLGGKLVSSIRHMENTIVQFTIVIVSQIRDGRQKLL